MLSILKNFTDSMLRIYRYISSYGKSFKKHIDNYKYSKKICLTYQEGTIMFDKVYWLCMGVLYLAGIIYVLFIPKNIIYIENTCENKKSSSHTTFYFIIGKFFMITSFSVILSFIVSQFLRF